MRISGIKERLAKAKPNIEMNRIVLPWQFCVSAKAIVAALALQKNALTELEWGYVVDIPVIKWLFAIFQDISGWGMAAVFLLAGLICMFGLLREHPLQKNRAVIGLALFFSICMVFCRSYYDLGNWNYIFHGRLQFGLACFVALGYYWLFKNIIVFLKYIYDKLNLSRTQVKGTLETFLFQQHPFIAPLAVIAVCCLPFLICFFPGTLQWDAHKQLWIYIGVFQPWTNNNPAGITWLMGECLHLSRTFFGNDSAALFLYAGPQFFAQWLVFAYAVYILSKMGAPVFLRKGTLLYFALFPLWQSWGFTVAKDTYHYICILLVLILFLHVIIDNKTRPFQFVLAALSAVFLTQSRNDGIYLLVLSGIFLLITYKRCWKLCVVMVSCAALSLAVVNLVYIPKKGIIPGPIGESLSIPLLQTTRYLKEYPNDITEKERGVLEEVFDVPPEDLVYNGDISDGIKAHFVPTSADELFWSYFSDVWVPQLCRHPDSYIQAFWDHVYGYFYPDGESHSEIGIYYIGNAQHWEDGWLDMEFAMDNREGRDFFEQEAHYFEKIPLFGMLYSCGLHNYILIGCIVYLFTVRQKRGLALLLPSVFMVIGCMFSPVNACIRYMLPVIAATPLHMGWCWYLTRNKEESEEI